MTAMEKYICFSLFNCPDSYCRTVCGLQFVQLSWLVLPDCVSVTVCSAVLTHIAQLCVGYGLFRCPDSYCRTVCGPSSVHNTPSWGIGKCSSKPKGRGNDKNFTVTMQLLVVLVPLVQFYSVLPPLITGAINSSLYVKKKCENSSTQFWGKP